MAIINFMLIFTGIFKFGEIFAGSLRIVSTIIWVSSLFLVKKNPLFRYVGKLILSLYILTYMRIHSFIFNYFQ